MEGSFKDNFLNIVYFGYGRTALEYGYKLIGMEPGDEIIYPEYICDVTLVPCRKMGITTRFYPVDERLNPDLVETKKLMTQRTKAFLSVNYFGFPQSFEEIRKFCKENNLIFIEDNAHGFLSRTDDILLGSFGDISVFSFRKTLGTFNGAALVINNQELLPQSEKDPKAYFEGGLLKERDLIKRLRVLKWYIERKLGKKLVKKELSIPQHGSTQDEDLPFLIDGLSLKKITKVNYTDEVERRRKMYSSWLEFSEGHDDILPLFPTLPDGVCPLAMPFLTDNRGKWLKWGEKKKLYVSPWPTLPFEVGRNSDSNAINLWKKLLLFPLV
jgi:perosamine synthetase